MYKTRYFTFTIGVAMLAAMVTLTAGPARAADETEQPLIDVLRSDAPKADKAITCKKLAVFGSKDCVPDLAALLPDPELTSWARIALEVIPGPEADAALRDAMDKVDGRVLIGVINSIGVRSDAKAIDALAEKLAGSDPDVASAAALALGRIGNAQTTTILEKTLTVADAKVRTAAAEGCVLCAENLLADGKAAEAAALYDTIRKADVSKQRVLEATRGAILARKSEPAGLALLIDQLRATDKAMFNLGLQTAREIAGEDVTKILAGELGQASDARRPLLVLALSDRDDPAVLPAVLQAAKAESGAARVVAIDVLRRVGDVSCVPQLIDWAIGPDADTAEAAKAALEGLPGDDINATLAAELNSAGKASRPVLIELAGRRRIAAAVPALLGAVDDPDAGIRSAALTALGETVGPDNLSVLIARVVAPTNAEDTEAAEPALLAASIRMPDGEACAAQLVAAISTASIPAKCTVLEILGAMGGENALAALGKAAKDPADELQDTASRLLGEWMDLDVNAGPVLLDLAKTAPAEKYKIRAMRGYIRLVRQFVMPDAQRVEMCRAALETAERDTEKTLVLKEVMALYPSVGMLRLSVEAAKIPSLKNDAAAVSLMIAQKIGGKAVDVQKLLTQIGHDPIDIKIIKAEYGAGTKIKDVTKTLQRYVSSFPLIVLPSDKYNSAFGGDPASGIVKQLRVEYTIDGKKGEATFAENATIMLPTPR
ncbi:MAG: HEAT repeat domain-containing protein [Thermoguttaceae bacterium]